MITNDNVLEGDEKFSLVIDPCTVIPSAHLTVSNLNQVTVTIYDDDDGK